MRKNIISVFALILVVFCTLFFQVIIDAWFRLFPVGNEYGVAYNDERVKRGILPIPENWSTRDYDEFSKTWKPCPGVEVRTSKIVVADENGIDSEIDYISKDEYLLEMIYNYKNASNPWRISFETNSKSRLLTKVQADSVLLQWGVLLDKW